MRKLENRIAIVTGAASGMGKATAKKMAEYGAKVNIIDFSPEVMTYAEALRNQGYEVTG
jgi:NAD(P)-dependent dehydrogenase (short-subunit alcohol dehydrogenase family)